MNAKRILQFIFVTAVLLAGCTTARIGDPRVIVDGSASGTVSVLHVGYDEIKSGSRTVDLTIRNERSSAQTVKVSVQWFANGQAFRSLLAEPRRVSLLPNEITTLHEVAPNVQQDSFRIVISKD